MGTRRDHRKRERRRPGWVPVAAACALGLMVLGCSPSGQRVERGSEAAAGEGVFAGNQGGAWEVLFAPAGVLPEVADAEVRRDSGMNVREAESVLMLGMWPEEPRPHLGRTRRLFLPRRADDVLYIREHPPVRYQRWMWR